MLNQKTLKTYLLSLPLKSVDCFRFCLYSMTLFVGAEVSPAETHDMSCWTDISNFCWFTMMFEYSEIFNHNNEQQNTWTTIKKDEINCYHILVQCKQITNASVFSQKCSVQSQSLKVEGSGTYWTNIWLEQRFHDDKFDWFEKRP